MNKLKRTVIIDCTRRAHQSHASPFWGQEIWGSMIADHWTWETSRKFSNDYASLPQLCSSFLLRTGESTSLNANQHWLEVIWPFYGSWRLIQKFEVQAFFIQETIFWAGLFLYESHLYRSVSSLDGLEERYSLVIREARGGIRTAALPVGSLVFLPSSLFISAAIYVRRSVRGGSGRQDATYLFIGEGIIADGLVLGLFGVSVLRSAVVVDWHVLHVLDRLVNLLLLLMVACRHRSWCFLGWCGCRYRINSRGCTHTIAELHSNVHRMFSEIVAWTFLRLGNWEWRLQWLHSWRGFLLLWNEF